MFWIEFEIGLNIYQSILFTWFIKRMLSPKKGADWVFGVCCLLTFAALSSYLFFPMPIWDTWIFCFIIAYSFFFFDDPFWKKLFFDAELIALSKSIAGIYNYLHFFVTGYSSEEMLEASLPRLLFAVSANLILWLTFFFIARYANKKKHLLQPSPIPIVLFTLCIVQSDLFFRLQATYSFSLFWLFSGCLITLCITATSAIINHRIVRYEQQKQRILFLEEMLAATKSHSEEQQSVFESIRHLHHDMRSYFSDVRKMVEAGQIDSMPEYLNQIEEKIPPLFTSGNYVMDSVFLVKLSKMQQSGIQFRGTNLHYTNGLNIEDYAFCSLISNMLDNAIEALILRKNISNDLYVYLRFAYTSGGLIVICENPLFGVFPKSKENSFFSSKSEPYHGLGLSIMENIVSDAGGQLDVVADSNMFRVLVFIPFIKESI